MPETRDIYGDHLGHPGDPSDFDTFEENVARLNPVKPEWEDIEAARVKLFLTGSDFKPTTREQIIGVDSVLDEIDTLVHWLRHSAEYLEFEARPEPGVLFEGEPGTGKTLCSRYIATASGAHFVNVRDWPHKGPLYTDSDIRELFKACRAYYAQHRRPIVLFWDEFENGACERSSASPEQTATVSQLTAELDGVHGKNEGLLLIGCTNYVYGIDAALRRSGRMGLQIEFHAPNREGKRVILEHYLSLKNVEGDIDTTTLAYFFDPDATAADIEEATEEAWRHAVRLALDEQRPPVLTQDDLVSVFIKRLVGPPMMFTTLSPDARMRIAVHEVGHALISLVYGIPLRLITVQPGKKSLGRTMHSELEDHVATVDEMQDHIRISLGSIAAEEKVGLPAMTGSMGDVVSANELATKLVDRLYAGKRTGLFNSIAVAGVRESMHTECAPNISDSYVHLSDGDVDSLLRTARLDTRNVMDAIGAAAIREIATVVNERTTLTGEEFAAVFADELGHDNFKALRG